MNKTLTENYLSLAAYCYKTAARHANNGNPEKAEKSLATARHWDTIAKETPA